MPELWSRTPEPRPLKTEKINNLKNAIKSLIANSSKHKNKNTRKLDEIYNGATSLGSRVTRLKTKMDEMASIPETLTSLTSR